MEMTVLRPWAFLFVIPALLFCLFRMRAVKTWLGIVDEHLLRSLLVRFTLRFRERLNIVLAGVGCLSVVCALAGVSVTGRQKTLYYPKSPAVIVLDMSLSMKAQDIAPNRLSRAVFKVYDLLDGLKGMPLAFIVFTDEPYQLVPVTTENEAVKAVLPFLNFGLMPSQGSRLDRALREALKTIKETGAAYGDIFLVTDGADDIFELHDTTVDLVQSASEEGSRLFILGIGTPEGGALSEKEGRPVLDALGNQVVHRLNENWLRLLAKHGNGAYTRTRADGSDVDFLMKAYQKKQDAGEQSSLKDVPAETDEGYWFLILPVLLFPFLFRRGRLLAIFIVFGFPSAASATDAVELFLSPSAAAMRALNAGNRERAVELAVRAGNFTALYNVGTQLIFLHDYQKAQELLELAVQQRSEDENAQINLEIARRLNQKPPSDTPENNPDSNASGQGENEGDGGDSESGNDLNQNNNNGEQHADNKEKDDGENSQSGAAGDSGKGQDGQSGQGLGNGRDGQSENENAGGGGTSGNGGADFDAQGGGTSGNGGGDDGNDESGSIEEPETMIPVHEDPLTLLRHKILFLYYEKRYAGEKKIGARW